MVHTCFHKSTSPDNQYASLAIWDYPGSHVILSLLIASRKSITYTSHALCFKFDRRNRLKMKTDTFGPSTDNSFLVHLRLYGLYWAFRCLRSTENIVWSWRWWYPTMMRSIVSNVNHIQSKVRWSKAKKSNKVVKRYILPKVEVTGTYWRVQYLLFMPSHEIIHYWCNSKYTFRSYKHQIVLEKGSFYKTSWFGYWQFQTAKPGTEPSVFSGRKRWYLVIFYGLELNSTTGNTASSPYR